MTSLVVLNADSALQTDFYRAWYFPGLVFVLARFYSFGEAVTNMLTEKMLLFDFVRTLANGFFSYSAAIDSHNCTFPWEISPFLPLDFFPSEGGLRINITNTMESLEMYLEVDGDPFKKQMVSDAVDFFTSLVWSFK